jgi:hypothetical protein
MASYIIKEIVLGVNWPFVLYVVIGVIITGVIVKYYNLSPVHLAIAVMREIRQLVESPHVTRTSIDGALTIAMILFTAAAIFVFAIDKISEVISLLRTGVEREGQPPLFVCFLIFWTSIVVIVSLVITNNGKRDL